VSRLILLTVLSDLRVFILETSSALHLRMYFVLYSYTLPFLVLRADTGSGRVPASPEDIKKGQSVTVAASHHLFIPLCQVLCSEFTM
jgi:hypothetical protein